MNEYFLINKAVIGQMSEEESMNPHCWVVSDWNMSSDTEGITIEYQQKNENGKFETTSSIYMGKDAADFLFDFLAKTRN